MGFVTVHGSLSRKLGSERELDEAILEAGDGEMGRHSGVMFLGMVLRGRIAVVEQVLIFFRCADPVAHWQALKGFSMQGTRGFGFGSTVEMCIIEQTRCTI